MSGADKIPKFGVAAPAQAKQQRHVPRAPRGAAMARRKVKGCPAGEFLMRAKRNRMPRLVAPKEFHEVGRHRLNRARRRARGHAPIKPMGARFVTCGVERRF